MNFKEHLKRYLNNEFINELVSSLGKERTNCLLLNNNKISNEQFENDFPLIQSNKYIENSYYYNKNIYEFGKSYLFDNGAYYIQDSASMMVANNLPLNDNDLILDMCAAPGGKSIFLALKNKNIQIVSNDLSYPRALVLSSNVEKIGLGNITVIQNDFNKNYTKFHKKFDSILLDAPCSGSAMFRKEIEMKNDWSYDKVLRCASIQKDLLNMAYFMLKEGGYLMYSTCSFSYEEDEEVVLNFLKDHEDIKTISIQNDPTFYHHKDLMDAVHLFPNKFKGEGQFFVLLKKDGEKLTNISINKPLKDDLSLKYNLNFNYKYNIRDQIYYSNLDINLFKNINILRIGVYVGEIEKNIFKPSFSLAHYLPTSFSIALSLKEKDLYLHGDSFSKDINLPNGFYCVSYNGINLGFVKNINNTLKNFYPKGLRH